MNRLCVTIGLLLLVGCKSPFESTRDASEGGALGPGTIGASGSLVVFNNELQTGGGAFLYPGDGPHAVAFNDTSNPVSARSIKYAWNGEAVAGHIDFAGFTLMHTPLQTNYTTTIGRDLSNASYTKVSFFARGTLSDNTLVKIEVSDDGNSGTAAPCVSLSPDPSNLIDAAVGPCGRLDDLSTSWQLYEIPILNSNLTNIKDFFKATLIYNQPGGSTDPGEGGTVFFDQIKFEG